MQTYFKSGTWNVVCQVCGRRYKSDAIRKRWDGLLVCDEDYEERNILDFLRIRAEKQNVPFQQNEPADQFVQQCDIFTASAIPYYALPGCSIPGVAPNFTSLAAPIPDQHWLHQNAVFAIPDLMLPDFSWPNNINHGGNDLQYVFDSISPRSVTVLDNRPGHEGETFIRIVP